MPGTPVDHRADIDLLGVMFYEMLAGELPLGRFPPPSQTTGVDARLDAVVLRTLERGPANRCQHVRDVGTAIEAIASDCSSTGRCSKKRPPFSSGSQNRLAPSRLA